MEVHYKKKHGVIQTKLLDGTVKKMQVNFAIPISEVLLQIGEKMSLPNVDEYALQLEGKSLFSSFLNPILMPSSGVAFKQRKPL
jgi:hypothetical protein